MTVLKHYRSFAFILMFLALCAATEISAQTQSLRLPRASQKASVMQTVGVTDVTITYSRPAVKGRKVWGNASAAEMAKVKGTATLDGSSQSKDDAMVPYGHVWRTGANEATIFAVTDDVMINGQKLPAGTYSLHTIPEANEWTIIFNSDAGQWGSFSYDEKKDVLRVKAKPQMVADNQESLSFTIPTVTDNTAQVLIRWEKMAVPFTVEIPNVKALMEQKIDAVVAANPTDWKIPLSVAGQYGSTNELDKALAWTDKSIAVKSTFQNLSAKARYLYAAGRKDEALTVADKAVAQGKADGVDTSRFEKMIENMKAGKM